MSNSKLVNYKKISPNSTNPRNHKIDKITIHHMAGDLSVETCGNIFADANREASSNYGIGSDGRIALYVEEQNRAWTSGNAANDNRAVNIEVANDGGAPDWHISDKALESLIALCVDICQRNGIKALNYTGDKSGNLTMHKWFQATACPGPYLESKFPYIAGEVNKRLGVSSASSGSATTSVGVGSVVRLKEGAKSYTGETLASFVYKRDHIVSSLKGDRAVITYGGVVVAAVRVSDLTVASKQTAKPAAKKIEAGSKVRVKEGARTYTGAWLASFVYDRVHVVKELKGDRAVITYGGIVVAAMKVSDLSLV